jgi:hypothetical protein
MLAAWLVMEQMAPPSYDIDTIMPYTQPTAADEPVRRAYEKAYPKLSPEQLFVLRARADSKTLR